MSRRKKSCFFAGIIVAVAFFFCCHLFGFDGQATAAVTIENKETNTEPPISSEVLDYIPAGKGEIVSHHYFTLSFNSQHKQANWVYYRLQARDEKKTGRTDNFREDKSVPSGSAKPSDYVNSGYDRGHLCPAGDMTYSTDAMSETFYMSNMSPQEASFNRGIWKSLEEKVRLWSRKGLIHVVTGPIFRDNKGNIGPNRVTVPGYYYKAVYSPSMGQMIGFVLPNEKGKKTLAGYVVSVDSVETLTGIDFFPQLPDTLENRLESRSSYQVWD